MNKIDKMNKINANLKRIRSMMLSMAVFLSPTLSSRALADQSPSTPTELPVTSAPAVSATQQLQNVQQKQNSNSTMYYLGAAAAGAFAVWQGTQCPTNTTACGLAAAGVVAAALLATSGGTTKAAANDAGAKANQLSSTSSPLPPGSDGSTTNGNGTTGGTLPTAGNTSGLLTSLPPAIASKLATAGISLNPAAGTITTPDGHTYNAAALAAGVTHPTSGSGIPNSGLTGSIKDEMKNAMDDAAKKMNDGSGSADLLTATGASRPSSSAASGLDSSVATRKIASAVNRDPAQVEGLKTLYNGEPIGVASDSIFGIVDRRYTEKIKTGSFNP